MQSFEDGDLIALFGQIARACQTGGTRTDDSNFMTVRLGHFRFADIILVVVVSHKAFKPAYADGLKLYAERTFAFALSLLRADPAAHRGQRRRLSDNLISALKVALLNFGDKFGNGDVDGASLDAGSVFAVEAPLRFGNRYFRGVAQGYLLKVLCPD